MAALVFTSPAMLVIFATVLFPLGYAFYLSLHRWNLRRPRHPYIGLGNYLDVLSDPGFWTALRTTLVFTALSVVLILTMGMGIALLLNERFVGRGLLRAALLIPWAVPHIVNGLMWKWLLDPGYGIINGLLSQLGLIKEYQSWLSNMPSALLWVVVAYVWKELPLATILLLAALQTIPSELYEAATVDGANALQRFRSITMPLVRPTVMVVLTFQTIFALRVFDIIYVLTGGGPGDATTVIGWLTYVETFVKLDFGRGSTLAYILALLSLLLAMMYFRVLGKASD